MELAEIFTPELVIIMPQTKQLRNILRALPFEFDPLSGVWINRVFCRSEGFGFYKQFDPATMVPMNWYCCTPTYCRLESLAVLRYP